LVEKPVQASEDGTNEGRCDDDSDKAQELNMSKHQHEQPAFACADLEEVAVEEDSCAEDPVAEGSGESDGDNENVVEKVAKVPLTQAVAEEMVEDEAISATAANCDIEHVPQDSKTSDADIQTEQVRLSISSTDVEQDSAYPEIRSQSLASNEEAYSKKVRISANSSQLDGSSESLANRSVVESEDDSAMDPDTAVDPSPPTEVDVLTSTHAELHDVNDGTDELVCMSGSESQADEFQAKRARVSDDESSEEVCSESSAANVEHDFGDNNVELDQSSDEENIAIEESTCSVLGEHATSQDRQTLENSPISKISEVAEECSTGTQQEDVAQDSVRTKRTLVDNDEPQPRFRRRLSGS